MTKHHTIPAHLRPKFVVAVQGHPVLWTDNDDDARIARDEHPGAVIYTPRLDHELAFEQLVDRDPEGYEAWLEGRQDVEPPQTAVSTDLASTLATIAVKAARYLGGSWTEQAAVDFAWWSVSQVGDAAEDEEDFGRHIRTWVGEVIHDAERLAKYQP